jgi:G3E family GTPase
MKTRIDIVSGYFGAGKSELLKKMLDSQNAPGGRIIACSAMDDWTAALETTCGILRRCRPGRLLLELPGDMFLEDIPAVLCGGDLMEMAYVGTRVFVMDGSAFHHGNTGLRHYYSRQISRASLVFVNRADRLGLVEKLEVLSQIWESNPRVQLIVEPLHGIDLWRVFDLPDFPLG